jgi:hypothetical protein
MAEINISVLVDLLKQKMTISRAGYGNKLYKQIKNKVNKFDKERY